MDYLNLIEERKSIRDFKDKAVSNEQVDEITAYHAQCRRLVPDINTEIIVLDSSAKDTLEGKAGYHGNVFGASHYLLLLSETHEYDIENAGYICEDLILKLTAMGLDSCWLTVTDEHALRKGLGLASDKHLLSIIDFGYGKKEHDTPLVNMKSYSDVDITFQKGHVAPKMSVDDFVYYRTWDNKVPLDDSNSDDGLTDACYAASLAPVYLNRQPFRMILDLGIIVLTVTADNEMPSESQRMSCGAVMLNFAVVLENSRPYQVKWNLALPADKYDLPAECRIVGYCKI